MVVTSSAQLPKAADITAALNKVLETENASQSATPFHVLYESLAPEGAPDDSHARGEDKQSKKDAEAASASKNERGDDAKAGSLMAAQPVAQVIQSPPIAWNLVFPNSQTEASSPQGEDTTAASTEARQSEASSVAPFASGIVSRSIAAGPDNELAEAASRVIPASASAASDPTTPESSVPAVRTDSSAGSEAPQEASSTTQLQTETQSSGLMNETSTAVVSHQRESAPQANRRLNSPKGYSKSEAHADPAVTEDAHQQVQNLSNVGRDNKPVSTTNPGTTSPEEPAPSSSPALRVHAAAAAPVNDTDLRRGTKRAAEKTAAAKLDIGPAEQPRMSQKQPLNVTGPQLPAAPGPENSSPDRTNQDEDVKQQAQPSVNKSTGEQIGSIPAPSLSKSSFSATLENFAFAVRLQHSDSTRQQPTPQQPAAHSQQTSAVKSEARPITAPAPAPALASRETVAPEIAPRVFSPQIQPVWSTGPVNPTHLNLAPETSGTTMPEIHARSIAATQDLQPLAAEAPKPPITNEIQLRLAANDQSSAASIKISDRAGAVNVSVHATDPQVRNTLHSNLSELSAQLNTQGWKTEVLRTAASVPGTNRGQDAPPDGKHSSSQQQSPDAQRQPQRERRPNDGKWQEQFEEQITGMDARTGGQQ